LAAGAFFREHFQVSTGIPCADTGSVGARTHRLGEVRELVAGAFVGSGEERWE